tara:strand:- start:21509 stop:21922 length:414 start_codon:yes stop_codon:yes gene_type:complete
MSRGVEPAMWMTSNIRTILIRRGENQEISVEEIDESEIPPMQNVRDDVFLHPLLIALSHSLILGDDFPMDTQEEKHKLSEDDFKNLETCSEITNCAICMENKKSNVKLKCAHIFCKGCIKTWLTEKSNTCPNCRVEI